jgi:hypothetical protein
VVRRTDLWWEGTGLGTQNGTSALSLTLDLAVADRLLAVNPCAKVKIARPEVALRRYLDHLQVRALANASGDRRAVVLLLAYGGLRWGSWLLSESATSILASVG